MRTRRILEITNSLGDKDIRNKNREIYNLGKFFKVKLRIFAFLILISLLLSFFLKINEFLNLLSLLPVLAVGYIEYELTDYLSNRKIAILLKPEDKGFIKDTLEDIKLKLKECDFYLGIFTLVLFTIIILEIIVYFHTNI